MVKLISILVGSVVTIALVVTAIWAWQLPPELADTAVRGSENPYLVKLGIRSLAIALAAGAQVVLLAFVIARVYPPRLVDRLVGVGVAVTSFAALGSAIVLALSSR
jgi:hypothetical protein